MSWLLGRNDIGRQMQQIKGEMCANTTYYELDWKAFANHFNLSTLDRKVEEVARRCPVPSLIPTSCPNHPEVTEGQSSLMIKSLNVYPILKEICPDAKSIEPCVCEMNDFGATSLLCDNHGLDDRMVDRILDAYRNSTMRMRIVTPLTMLVLSNNQLTRIPKRIHYLPHLTTISLKNNLITTLEDGSFKFTQMLRYLDLSNNEITTIESGAIRGKK